MTHQQTKRKKKFRNTFLVTAVSLVTKASLKDRHLVIWVTGASTGLGRELARQYAGAGHVPTCVSSHPACRPCAACGQHNN